MLRNLDSISRFCFKPEGLDLRSLVKRELRSLRLLRRETFNCVSLADMTAFSRELYRSVHGCTAGQSYSRLQLARHRREAVLASR
jgi:hypothetical protein